jgi:hypothetical protein
MKKEMIDLMIKIFEEDNRKNGLDMAEICVDVKFEEVRVFVEETENMDNVMNFAYKLTSKHQSTVHVVSKLQEDEEEVILVLNEKFSPENMIKVIIR